LKTGSVSPWLFAKPAKTASYNGEKCPKMLWDSLQKDVRSWAKLSKESL
jgi:hypothetical protein